MDVDKINSEKQARRDAMKQLQERDQVLAQEIADRNRERSALKVKFDNQVGALAQLQELVPDEPKGEIMEDETKVETPAENAEDETSEAPVETPEEQA